MTERRQHSQRGGALLSFIVAALITSVITLVVLAVGGVGLYILDGRGGWGGRGTNYFTPCQSNLRSIGTAMAAYRQDNNNRMPVIKMREAVAGGANSAPTAANQTDEPFSSGQWQAMLGDQAMQNVWLLIVNDNIEEGMFRCPGDKDWVERPAHAAKYGWTDPHQYSYGMQWPYQQDAAGNANPARLGTPSTVMLADRSPGGPVGESRLPSNHPKNGLNVALASGGADKFTDTASSTAGSGDDEIYTNAAGEVGGLPQARKDTSITLSGRETN